MNPLHILVLHRDSERRAELIELLRGAGRTTVPAESSKAALKAWGPGINLLVLDLTLPDLDLPALWRAIGSPAPGEPDSLDNAEKRHLSLVLQHTAGNKRKAAHILGISRSTLLHKVRKYRLEDS
jgi:DNA-binding NtrC family response regulator